MKLSISQAALEAALSHVQGVVEKKTTMPILSNVLWKTTANDRVRWLATDLDLFLQGDCEVLVEEGGEACFKARDVLEVVKQLDGDRPITLETIVSKGPRDDEGEDTASLRLTQGRSVYHWPLADAPEFPQPPNWEAKFNTVRAVALKRLIKLTLFAAAVDDPRTYLNGVFIETVAPTKKETAGLLRFVATDGHRLALAEESFEDAPFKLEKGVIVPRKALAEVAKVIEGIGDPNATVEVAFGNGLGAVRFNGLQLTFRLIEGKFPDYKQVFPARTASKLAVDRIALMRALRRLGAMTSADYTRTVRFLMSTTELVLESKDPEKGRGREPLDSTFEGESPLRVGYHYKFVLDVLSLLDEPTIQIGFNDPLSPTVLTVAGDDKFKCIVMPLDLRED